MCQKGNNKKYYERQIKHCGGFFLYFAALLTAVICGSCQLLRQKNKETPEDEMRIEVTFDGWISELSDPNQCYLCGNNDRSQIGCYKNQDTIGLISLNDWTIIAFQLKENHEETKNSGIRYGNTGSITYRSSGDPSRGMARVCVNLPEERQLDGSFLRQNLCQSCLNQVTDSLCFWRRESEEKQAVPLCLVDFQTLEIYPLQDWYQAYFIRDYWVELDFEETAVSINAYYLPKRAHINRRCSRIS